VFIPIAAVAAELLDDCILVRLPTEPELFIWPTKSVWGHDPEVSWTGRLKVDITWCKHFSSHLLLFNRSRLLLRVPLLSYSSIKLKKWYLHLWMIAICHAIDSY
jgi:hypothetical protein